MKGEVLIEFSVLMELAETERSPEGGRRIEVSKTKEV